MQWIQWSLRCPTRFHCSLLRPAFVLGRAPESVNNPSRPHTNTALRLLFGRFFTDLCRFPPAAAARDFFQGFQVFFRQNLTNPVLSSHLTYTHSRAHTHSEFRKFARGSTAIKKGLHPENSLLFASLRSNLRQTGSRPRKIFQRSPCPAPTGRSVHSAVQLLLGLLLLLHYTQHTRGPSSEAAARSPCWYGGKLLSFCLLACCGWLEKLGKAAAAAAATTTNTVSSFLSWEEFLSLRCWLAPNVCRWSALWVYSPLYTSRDFNDKIH